MDIHTEIEEIKRRLNIIEAKDRIFDNGDDSPSKQPFPYTPLIPPAYAANLCPKCGITLEKVMMYSCQQTNCPTGLGSLGGLCTA